MSNEKEGVRLSPKASFALGMVGGVLVLCTIGFFVLLSIIMNGNAELNPAAAAAEPSDVIGDVADTAPTPGDDGPTVGDIVPIGDGDHAVGPADAGVQLIVYTDFECPYCSRFHPSLEKALAEFDGQVRATIRHFPLSFHNNARPAANAAECAAEQGKYWEYAHELFANQGALSTDTYKALASDLGLKTGQFNDCLESGKYDDKVSADQNSGMESGVRGTPGTLIVPKSGEAQLVPGAVPYEQFKLMIESAL
jgi:protein-disulfide isomerase